MTEYTTISIPKQLHQQIKERIEETSFTSVAEFAKHVLRDTVAGGDLAAESHLSPDEVRQVRKRLQSLGYLE